MQSTRYWGWVTLLYMFSGKEGTGPCLATHLLGLRYVTTTQGTPGSSLRHRRQHLGEVVMWK